MNLLNNICYSAFIVFAALSFGAHGNGHEQEQQEPMDPMRARLKSFSFSPIRGEILSPADMLTLTWLLGEAQEGKNIVILNLTGQNIGKFEAEMLKDMLEKNSTIQKLSLGKNNLGNKGSASIPTDFGLQDIAQAMHLNTGVTELLLPMNNIHDEGALYLAGALGRNKTLQELNLSTNKISNKGAKSLADALKDNKTLKVLNLSGNTLIDTTGAQAFVDMLNSNTTLLKLEIDNNNHQIDENLYKKITEALKRNNSIQQ